MTEQLYTLTEKQRAVIEARFFQNKTLDETVAALGMNRNVVAGLQYRAMHRLRRHEPSLWRELQKVKSDPDAPCVNQDDRIAFLKLNGHLFCAECALAWYDMNDAPINLHPTSRHILKVIREAHRMGHTPSMKELCQICGLASIGAIMYHMRCLAKTGYIIFGRPRSPRAYHLTNRGRGYPSDMQLLRECQTALEARGVTGPLVDHLRMRLM